MQRCLLYKIVDRQDKCDKVGNQGPEGRKCRPSPERLAEVRGIDQIRSMLAARPSGGPDPPRRELRTPDRRARNHRQGQPGLQIGHAGRAVAVAVFPGTQIFNLQLYPNELRLQFCSIDLYDLGGSLGDAVIDPALRNKPDAIGGVNHTKEIFGIVVYQKSRIPWCRRLGQLPANPYCKGL